ncbi:hypothetical protein [Kineococcus sp. NPDC059986]|uniref:hypothetical protein n=1 Tax=Kineococcus sp. NPDC059986 TaxID=3155538 RepID=UPI00344D70AF
MTAVAELVEQAARKVHRVYREVELDDLRQEGHLWCHTHQERIEHLLDRYPGRLRAELKKHMGAYAERTLPLVSGFKPEHLDYYRVAIVEMALTEILHNLRGHQPEGEWGQLVSQVRVAYQLAGLGPELEEPLLLRYAACLQIKQVAEHIGFSWTHTQRLIYRALKAIADQLDVEDFLRTNGLVLRAPSRGTFPEETS